MAVEMSWADDEQTKGNDRVAPGGYRDFALRYVIYN